MTYFFCDPTFLYLSLPVKVPLDLICHLLTSRSARSTPPPPKPPGCAWGRVRKKEVRDNIREEQEITLYSLKKVADLLNIIFVSPPR